jgi:hypothetical protein
MSESSWSSDEEWTTIAAMVRDTQDNGSNAVEGDTEDGSSLTNRQQLGSNDTQGTNATPTLSRTIAAIVVHSSSEDQLDSDILLPETNEYEAYYFD